MVPAGVNVDEFDYVIVWCPTAGVNFGVAELEGAGVAVRGDADRDDSAVIEQRIESLCASTAISAQLERLAGRMSQHEQEHTAAVQIERIIGEAAARAGS